MATYKLVVQSEGCNNNKVFANLLLLCNFLSGGFVCTLWELNWMKPSILIFFLNLFRGTKLAWIDGINIFFLFLWFKGILMKLKNAKISFASHVSSSIVSKHTSAHFVFCYRQYNVDLHTRNNLFVFVLLLRGGGGEGFLIEKLDYQIPHYFPLGCTRCAILKRNIVLLVRTNKHSHTQIYFNISVSYNLLLLFRLFNDKKKEYLIYENLFNVNCVFISRQPRMGGIEGISLSRLINMRHKVV